MKIKALPARTDDGPPLLREHRLYQADWLLRYYHFQADELLSEEEPNFNVLFDPKCNWALKHLEYFPVEINRADYEMLLRVPGLGYKSATRIVKARRLGTLDFADLKKLGVVLKRAVYFITCNGKTMYPLRIEEESIARNLLDSREKLPQEVRNLGYRQLSLFDDVRFRENFYEKRFMCVMIRSQEYFLQFMMHGKKEEKKKECGIAIKGMLEQELFVSTFWWRRIFTRNRQ